jgi:sucrose phosphorylase
MMDLLVQLYGESVAKSYIDRFTSSITDQPIPVREHTLTEQSTILIAYGDHIKRADEAPLKTLGDFCKHRLSGSVDSVHILPHYPVTENGFTDGGFAVSDYEKVNPELGTWEDVHQLSAGFHLMLDDVLNHSSISHPWFKRFLEGDPHYTDYYVSFDEPVDVSLVVRPRAHPLLTPFKTAKGTKYVWTTFSTAQADLNYANPEVLLEAAKILLSYVRHGADLIRLDAVGYVWKEVGSASIHHANAYAIVQFLREVLLKAAPWVMLVSETNVPHKENISYFGNGHDQAQMIYNFTLPPLVVHTLQAGNAAKLTTWAATLETPSDETTFFNFTASHDGIGVRGILDILDPEEIETMYKSIAARGGLLSYKSNPDGSQSVYEMNISYFNAVTDPTAPVELAVKQFICSQAIALSLKGVPGIYTHSILGSTNWLDGVAQSGENRSINREKLAITDVERALADPLSLRSQVLTAYSHLLNVRRKEPLFSPLAGQEILSFSPEVFALKRTSPDTSSELVALHNISSQPVEIRGACEGVDIISGEACGKTVTLTPYQVRWIKTA